MKNIMKAIVYTQYGSTDVLQFKEVEKPTPKANEVLIKIHAASLNVADSHIISGSPLLVRLMTGGLTKPKRPIPGSDMAGVVEAVGSDVKLFRPGDAVYGDLNRCGLGAFAEYVAAPENVLALKPANLSFEQTAAVPMAAVTALQGFDGRVQPGQKVLVNGASGGVGSFAVQIAKAFGAEVTGVCSTKKIDTVRAIGADHVIDYKHEDFTQNGQRYDFILDAAAYRPMSEYKRSLTPNGIYVMAGGATAELLKAMLTGPLLSRGGQKMSNLMANPDAKDLNFLNGLFEAGKVVPVIDRCYPLSETAAAVRYFEGGHAAGKVVIGVVG